MFLSSQEQNDEAFKLLERCVTEKARQTDLKLSQLFAEFSDLILNKLTDLQNSSERSIERESVKNKLSVDGCRDELSKKLVDTTDYISEMAQDMRNNSDFEFKAVKVKSNCLEEKMNIIELQLDQVMEVISKLNTSIVNLNK